MADTSVPDTSPASDPASGSTALRPVLVLALDGDRAGRNATNQLRTALDGHDVRVLRVPDDHDLTSLYTRKKTISCPLPTPPSRTTSNASSRS